MSPKISVLMSVLNGEAFLAAAIDSILSQSYKDFEFVIVDNASTDRTTEIIDIYDDLRIVLLRNSETLNLSQSLNKGLHHAKGKYVARLDADDLALPDRLEKQARYLDDHSDVALVASAFSEFSDAEAFPGHTNTIPPEKHDPLITALAGDSILAHSSIMFRREAALKIGGYDEEFTYCMDYLLYFRLAEQHHLAALPETLVAIRVHEGQITARPQWETRRHLEAIKAFNKILSRPGLLSMAQREMRRYLILTSLRLAALFARSFNPIKSLLWLCRAFLVKPVDFFSVTWSVFRQRVFGD